MAGFLTTNTSNLIRTDIFDAQLKETFQADLYATQWINWITDRIPDGDTLHIPSIGQLEAQDFNEGEAVKYTAFDTGTFSFTIDKYLASATYISDKMMQDSYVSAQVKAKFVPQQARAIAAIMETDFLKLADNYQTASNSNTINGGKHRFMASGTNGVMTLEDFAKARYALRKANAPLTNLIAIVDPSVEITLSTLPNFTNMSNNIMWEGVVTTGLSTGTRFMKNIYGWDVYVSDYLPISTASETIDSVALGAGAVHNLFFTADSSASAFVGAVRQAPRVESERNKDLQRDEVLTTCRYGMKLFRPECVVVVPSATDQVYA